MRLLYVILTCFLQSNRVKLSEILQGISVFLGNFMGKKTLNKKHHYSISLKNKTQQWSTFLLILLSIFLKYPHFVLMISFILMISSSLHAICSIIYVWERPTYASDGDQTSWDIYLPDKLKSPFICFNLKKSNFFNCKAALPSAIFPKIFIWSHWFGNSLGFS